MQERQTIMNKALIVISSGLSIIILFVSFRCNHLDSLLSSQKAEYEHRIESIMQDNANISSQNERLRSELSRINAAYNDLSIKCSHAEENRNERESKINGIDNDWLVCELPAGVQDLFK